MKDSDDSAHLPVVDRDAVGRRHVHEHAPEPIVGDLGQEVRGDAELGAGEGRRDRVATEGDRVIARHRLLVAGRDVVGEEGDVDVGLADEESLHRCLSRVTPAANRPAGATPDKKRARAQHAAVHITRWRLCARTGLRDPVRAEGSRGMPWPSAREPRYGIAG